MLGDNQKGVLDKPDIVVREAALRAKPVKKRISWVVKIIIILVVILVIYYLFRHPEVIRDPVNSFFGNLLK